MKIAITGGFGFIGANLVNHLSEKYPDYTMVIIDHKDHYAAQPENVVSRLNVQRYMNVDIRNALRIWEIFDCEKFDAVIHLAAESHVDNSIQNPLEFVETNVLGTASLLRAAQNIGVQKFYHISTDEVYGHLSLKDPGFKETTPYAPRSPYSASKASSDHFVRAWHHTYGLPVVISNCSNNYGKFQHQEKLIPTVIRNLVQKTPIPVYGTGENVRDWLYVEDHCRAIDVIFHKGRIGETYNIGGAAEMGNINLVQKICDIYDAQTGGQNSRGLIEFVEDRKGHDFRYSVNFEKLMVELKWMPSVSLNDGLAQTVDWYVQKYEAEKTNTSQVQE